MRELLALLAQFIEILKAQAALIDELLPELEAEESHVSGMRLSEFERTVVAKEQIVRRITNLETRRDAALRRICFLIAFDMRAGNPNLSGFQSALRSYVENTKSLLDAETNASLEALAAKLDATAAVYLAAFSRGLPAVYRNRQVMTRLKKNMDRSIALLQSDTGLGGGYGSDGKVSAPSSISEPGGSLRVRA